MLNLTNAFHELIQTTADLEKVLVDIETLSGALYKRSSKSISQTVESTTSSKTADILLKFLAENPEIDPRSFSKILKDLETDLQQTLERIVVTFTIDPTPHLIEQVTRWVREKLGPQKILDIKVDPHLIGGLEIISGGKVFDFSLRKKLAALLGPNNDRLADLMK